MHANDIAFGIEIETHMPGTDRTPIGGYHNGLPVAWLPEGWKAERDGSIRTPAGRKPCEYVSPLLRGYGPFGKKCRIRYLKSSAMQHRKKMPRMSAGRFAMDCSFRRASCFNSLLFFA